MFSEIGLDMSHFYSEKYLYLSSWVGLSPGNNKSAGKKSSRITHGNKHLKAVIIESV